MIESVAKIQNFGAIKDGNSLYKRCFFSKTDCFKNAVILGVCSA